MAWMDVHIPLINRLPISSASLCTIHGQVCRKERVQRSFLL
jgi:hypothetical protein